MGVMCQIYLQKPPDGNYRPGSAVHGTVKYAIDKETIYKDIVVSLIGKGKCHWSEPRGDGKSCQTYYGSEELVTVHTKLLDTKLDVVTLPAGVYSHQFQFIFPSNIPPSYKDYHCTIAYHVVLKFERPGLFNFTKTFRTELPVVSTISSPLSEPIMYGLQKSLFQLFASKKSVINLKATIAKSLVAPGERIDLQFEVENDSNVKIPYIKTELEEQITYKADCGKTKRSYKKIKDCKSETDDIGPGKVKILTNIVQTVPNISTIQHSKVLTRDYKLTVTVKLPMPHFDATLYIPVFIGDKEPEIELAQELLEDVMDNDSPPSYWEAMAEDEASK